MSLSLVAVWLNYRPYQAELEQRKQHRKRRRTDDVKKEPKEDPDAVPKMKLLVLEDGVIDLTQD